jgi:hypothetical protein
MRVNEVAGDSTGGRLHTEHPYATGFRVTAGATPQVSRQGAYYPWPQTPAGEHQLSIQALTSYGALAPRSLRYRTR